MLRTDAGTTEHDGVSVHWSLPEMGEALSAATIELAASASLQTLMPFSVEMHSKSNICSVEVRRQNVFEKHYIAEVSTGSITKLVNINI